MKFRSMMLVAIMNIALITSCKDFLDIAPESVATTENAYNTAADLDAALVGTYRTLYTDYFIWENFVMSDVRSDNAYAGGDDAELYQYDNLKVSPLNSRILLTWSQLYNGISNANLVIQKATESTDSELSEGSRRADMIAEAKFLRALYYFELVRGFGAVPIVKQFSQISPEQSKIPRSPVIDVYNFIVEDLEAATNLPSEYTSVSLSKSKVTKGAVYALLAKVYAQRPDRDYAKVLEYCEAVEKLGYGLHESYDELFDGLHYNNKEAIFLVQYNEGTPESNWGPQLLLPPSLSGDDWRKYVTPSKDLLAAYDAEGDVVRKDASVIMEDVEWADEFWKPCASAGSVPFPFKFRHASAWQSGDNVYILRFDDILLLKAEALNELNRGAEALIPLNKIRDRVDLPDIGITGREQLRNIILNERRLELAFEGYRWDDLIRNGKVMSTMNSLKEFKLTCSGESSPMVYNMTENKAVMPVPQTELNRNSALAQNAGY